MEYQDFSTHISEKYNQELQELLTQLLSIGGYVEKQMNLALEALQTTDLQKAREVHNIEKIVDKEEISLDYQASRIIARHNPIASDLRLVLSALKINANLERISDEIDKTVYFVKEAANSPYKLCSEIPGFKNIEEMMIKIQGMIKLILDSIAKLDIETAYDALQEEKEINKMYNRAFEEVSKILSSEEENINLVLEVLLLLKALERVGDHIENIAEHILYVVAGKDIRAYSDKDIFAIIKKNRA